MLETLAELILSITCFYFGIKVYEYFNKKKEGEADVSSIQGMGGGIILFFAGILFLLLVFDIF